MKATLQQYSAFCVGCKERLNPNEETQVVEIRVGTIKHGIFNRAYNYPTQYVHEGCYEDYLQRKVELRSEYASNRNKRNPA